MHQKKNTENTKSDRGQIRRNGAAVLLIISLLGLFDYLN